MLMVAERFGHLLFEDWTLEFKSASILQIPAKGGTPHCETSARHQG